MPNLFNSQENKPYKLQKYNKNQKSDLIDALSKKISIIDQEIAQASKDLLQVQITKARATFSTNSNWFDRLQKQFYWSTIEDSSNFHKANLLNLYKERKAIQRTLDKLNGQFWIKIISRWIIYIFLSLMILLIIWIFFMGLLASLYLLPFWGLIIIIIFLLKK